MLWHLAAADMLFPFHIPEHHMLMPRHCMGNDVYVITAGSGRSQPGVDRGITHREYSNTSGQTTSAATSGFTISASNH